MESSAVGLAAESQVEKSELSREHVLDAEKADSSSSTLPTPPEPTKEEEPIRQIHGVKWVIAYISILSSTFLFALDNTIVADIQPSIVNQFGRIQDLPWIGVAFALGSIAILPWGKAYGVFNIKWLYISTVVLFEGGSALCGGAPNMNALILGRVIGGVGGSGMYSGCLTYIAVTTSTVERPLYMAGIAIVWGIGSVLGPVVGGAFANSGATWRWAFYINLVIGAVFAPAYLFLIPNVDLRRGVPLSKKLRMMDWPAIAIFFAGTTCFTLAINLGGTTYAWNSGSEIALWVMTGVLLIAMVVVTWKHPFVEEGDKLYPSHFLRRPVLVNLQIQLFFVSGVMLIATYYIPLFFQFTKGDTSLKAGVRLLPFIVMIVFFSIVNGGLMPKLGYYTPWYLFGSAMALTGSALMYTITPQTSTARIYAYTTLMGIGVGAFLTAGFAIAQALVPAHDVNNAVGFMSISQVLGAVVFLAVGGSIYQNLAVKHITPVLAPDGASAAAIESVITGTSGAGWKGLAEGVRGAVVQGIVAAMREVWLLLAVGMAVSFALSLFLGRQKLYLSMGAAAA